MIETITLRFIVDTADLPPNLVDITTSEGKARVHALLIDALANHQPRTSDDAILACALLTDGEP